MKTTENRKKIYDLLLDKGPMGASEIEQALDLTKSVVWHALKNKEFGQHPDARWYVKLENSRAEELLTQIRVWTWLVFTGRCAFQENTEQDFLESAKDTKGQNKELDSLVDNWVRPRLSVGPGPRAWQELQKLSPEAKDEIKNRIKALNGKNIGSNDAN